jgi:hypothetical protein
VLAVFHEGLTIYESVGVTGAALNVPASTVGKIVDILGRWEPQIIEGEHVDIGKPANLERATIGEAKQIRCVGGQPTDTFFDAPTFTVADPIRKEIRGCDESIIIPTCAPASAKPKVTTGSSSISSTAVID